MAAKELVEILLQVSEKSAKIARAWRCQEELFELMVEEKAEKEKNERFVRDFKTLADVLVQEVVKHDVSLKVSWIDRLHYFVQSFLKQESIHHRCNFFSYHIVSWTERPYFGRGIQHIQKQLWPRNSNWGSRRLGIYFKTSDYSFVRKWDCCSTAGRAHSYWYRFGNGRNKSYGGAVGFWASPEWVRNLDWSNR